MTADEMKGHRDLSSALPKGEALMRVGKYRIDGVIGRGAVGVVYKGHDEAIDRPVAIKTLRVDVIADEEHRDTVLQRFSIEARSAGRCLHPNIVTVFDYVEQDGAPNIIMEYVEAGTLENVINSGTMLPVRQVGEIMAQLLLALDHAHSKGVIHRDVKPANILCPSATSIKVTDFGVARFDAMGLTNPNGIGAIGTPNYMSPEQFLGRPVDARSDMFSAGVILFQLLAGAKPFVASDLAELMRKLLNERPPPLATLRPGCGPHLDALVQTALARNPDDRFQTAEEFVDAMNDAIEATALDHSPPLDLTKFSETRTGEPTTSGAGASNSKSGLSQTMAARLTPATMEAVGGELARAIGPIARVVVRRVAEQSSDLDSLLTSLCKTIPGQLEATRFRESAERTIRADTGVAAVQLDAMISPEEIQAATKALIPMLGPVARVLAERQAKSAIGHDDYYRRLAEAIPDAAGREQFLSAMLSARG